MCGRGSSTSGGAGHCGLHLALSEKGEKAYRLKGNCGRCPTCVGGGSMVEPADMWMAELLGTHLFSCGLFPDLRKYSNASLPGRLKTEYSLLMTRTRPARKLNSYSVVRPRMGL